jgi:CDP-6-deoxy-D-xylo-4-hexulose-3-dehydrase
MISLVSDTIDKDDINALIKWLSSDEIPRLTKGNLTIELEKKWANKIGTKYSVFVNSGSSAILLLLASLKDYPKNNKIIVPALSWATDVSSPMILGYDTIFCDCNMEDLSCDLNQLEYLFKTEQPSIFLSVCPLGLVPKMNELMDLCHKYDVILLEDVCESMGSKYKGQYLGSFGMASIFSTYFGHHISTIEGGFINTNDDNLYYSLIMMRSHGWDRDLPLDVQSRLREIYNVSDFKSLYTFYVPGFNLRSTDFQAFLGLRAIDKLDDYSNKRYENFKLYHSLVKKNKINMDINDENFISNFAYPVVLENKDKVVVELLKNDIEIRPLIAGNMGEQPFCKHIKQNLKNAKLIDRNGFYVPNHQGLTDIEILKISAIINNS